MFKMQGVQRPLQQGCLTKIPIRAVLKGTRATIDLENFKIIQSLNVNLQKNGAILAARDS